MISKIAEGLVLVIIRQPVRSERPQPNGRASGGSSRTDHKGRTGRRAGCLDRSEEHTSELQSLMRNSYAVFCLKKKTNKSVLRRMENANTDDTRARSRKKTKQIENHTQARASESQKRQSTE